MRNICESNEMDDILINGSVFSEFHFFSIRAHSAHMMSTEISHDCGAIDRCVACTLA